MARRSTPDRIFVAWRAGAQSRLIGSGMPADTANAWCDAWEAEATRRGMERDGRYWDDGLAWITAERAIRRTP